MARIETRKRAKIDEFQSRAIPKKITRMESSSSCESSKIYPLNVSYITFEYGPSELNLFKYVAEEYEFLWENLKKICILNKNSEPEDGLILLHGDSKNVPELCMDLFRFDAKTTKFESRKKIPKEIECVVVCYLGNTSWTDDKISVEDVKRTVKDIDPCRLFFITDAEQDEAVTRIKRLHLCPPLHVIRATSDMGVIYNALYNTLEKKLNLLKNDLESKTSTRKVAVYKSQLEALFKKLQERKPTATQMLTEDCIRNLKDGRRFGVVGYRLRGETLYVFENEKSPEKEDKMKGIKNLIQENFKGKVLFKTLTSSSYNPHSAINCGGYIVNIDRNMRGTIGIFGKIKGNLPENLTNSHRIVALTSGHMFMENDIAHTIDQLSRIGKCIWPKVNANPSSIMPDFAVVQLDPAYGRPRTHIYDENVFIQQLTKTFLSYRKVFKFGATTGETTGRIEKIDNFEMFDKEVMIILPENREDPQKKFSEEGDSGAIVLTRDMNRLYAVGMVYGDDFDFGAECETSLKECIAFNFKNALDHFTQRTHISLEFNTI
ncbi:uncharacterized protein LOC134250104 [Saccostrea cucullata]|uniref:uncharacterized protein LOC134250104 n=1 Tax=Saccostrea cuccullata TaxID=36930 RepID=UPI002ED4269E